MTQTPASSRPIPPPGVLAVAVLALGLLCAAPSLAAPASPPPPADDLAAEPVPSAFCRPGSLPAGEALRHDHPTRGGLDWRPTPPGVLLVPRGGTPRIELPAWLAPFRGRLPSPVRPSLHVLFCTWLA